MNTIRPMACVEMCGWGKKKGHLAKNWFLGDDPRQWSENQSERRWEAVTGWEHQEHHILLVDVGTTVRLLDGFCYRTEQVICHRRNGRCFSIANNICVEKSCSQSPEGIQCVEWGLELNLFSWLAVLFGVRLKETVSFWQCRLFGHTFIASWKSTCSEKQN